MFVPPYTPLLNSLNISKLEAEQRQEINVPLSLLKLLLQIALAQADFSEDGYLAANPDVGFAEVEEKVDVSRRETDASTPADQVVKAVGQQKPSLAQKLGLEIDRGFVRASGDLETNLPGVYAGGDCIRAKNAASTVMAVQDGKLAAQAIHIRLQAVHTDG